MSKLFIYNLAFVFLTFTPLTMFYEDLRMELFGIVVLFYRI